MPMETPSGEMTGSPLCGEKLTYNVEKIDGIYCVKTNVGTAIPIKTEGDSLLGQPGTFGPAWEPQFVYAGFAPIYYLEWRHRDGQRGNWYLNGNMKCIGGSHNALLPDALSTIHQKGKDLLTSLWDQILCRANPVLDDSNRAFIRLHRQTTAPIVQACSPSLSIVDLVPQSGVDQFFKISNGSRMIECRSQLLIRCLGEEPLIAKKAISDIPSGIFTWPSPIDGHPLSTDTAIFLDEFRYLYRLVDSTHDLVFYVVAAGHCCRTLALLFPAARQVYRLDKTRFEPYLSNLSEVLMQHLCDYSELLESYIAAPKKAFLWYLHANHFGHLLQNELSGVDDLVHRLPKSKLPEIAMQVRSPLEGDVEVYGKVDELFPEIAGKVHRSIFDRDNLTRRVYSEKFCIFKPTYEYIPRRLAERVVKVNLQGTGLEPEWQLLNALRAKNWPIMQVDLRVESRTLVDLTGFCGRLIEFLLSKAPGAAVVLSGHTGSYVSEVDQKAQKSPIDVQKEIVAELTRRFAYQNVELINNVGQGMRRTVFWSHHAHFFVAPWGASLVTYRWICNKPGVIMTNTYNLQHGRAPGTDIYSSPAAMEHPVPVTYLAKEFVEDDPNSPTLSSWRHSGQEPESFYNFRVNEAVVFQEVLRLLGEFGPLAARSAYGQNDTQV